MYFQLNPDIVYMTVLRWVCSYRGLPLSHSSMGKAVDGLAWNVAREDALCLLLHRFIEDDVQEMKLRPLLGITDQCGSLPRTWNTPTVSHTDYIKWAWINLGKGVCTKALTSKGHDFDHMVSLCIVIQNLPLFLGQLVLPVWRQTHMEPPSGQLIKKDPYVNLYYQFKLFLVLQSIPTDLWSLPIHPWFAEYKE